VFYFDIKSVSNVNLKVNNAFSLFCDNKF
jgi:hypothetical protein